MKRNPTLKLAIFGTMAAAPLMAAGQSNPQTGGCCSTEVARCPVEAFHSSATMLISTEAETKTTHHEAHADHMLEGYAVVSTALYKDDLEAAKKTAAGMVKHDKDSAMAPAAQAIADSKTIEEARKHFKDLSDVAIPIAKHEKTMHEAHCPMALGGKGANWLQKSDDEIQNPYFGKNMPHCGEMVK